MARTALIVTTRTSTIKSHPIPPSTTLSPHPKPTIHLRLAARSAITLYPPAGGDATSTSTQPSTSTSHTAYTHQPSSATLSSSSSATIPASAFWGVLACLIGLLVILALACPLWYFLRGRIIKSIEKASPSPSSSPMSSTNTGTEHFKQPQPPQSPRSWLLSSLASSQQGQAPLTPNQQLQLLHHFSLQQPPPASHYQQQHPSPMTADPNKSALLARLAALNNPSILGAIPEDSTVLTSSSVHPRPPAVNSNYRNMAERRMAELRQRTEGHAVEEGGVEMKEGKKTVRFREQEWAVLG
ncbi:MAG: hypothetical protein Q9181_005347, partial [Wetmoreana brouardii]